MINTIILELSVSEIPQVNLPDDGVININLLGVDYEVTLNHSSIEAITPQGIQVDYCTSSLLNYVTDYRTYLANKKLLLKGYGIDKKFKELCEAKEDVRKKQQEFKDAQRKLSELMGNTN